MSLYGNVHEHLAKDQKAQINRIIRVLLNIIVIEHFYNNIFFLKIFDYIVNN